MSLSLTGVTGRKALAGSVVLVLALGCRSKPADVDEIFTTRTLALGYLRRSQLPEAEAQLKKLIELVPNESFGYANLGLTYLQSGRYREAERQLRRARELDPANADVALLVAKLYSLTNRTDEARRTLEELRDTAATARTLYALAELDAQRSDSAGLGQYEERLRRVVAVAPANLAVRLQLIDVLARRGVAGGDSALAQLEEVRRIPPAPPNEAKPYLDSTIRSLQRRNLAEARGPLRRYLDLMEGTAPYQASLDEVKWAEAPLVGRPVLTFAATHLITQRGVRETATTDSTRFLDVTDEAGLIDPAARQAAGSDAPSSPTALAVGDVDGDGDDDLFTSSWPAQQGTSQARLYFVQGGFARDMSQRAGVSLPNGAVAATFGDVDNDGWLDLFVIGGDGRASLLRNRANGTFEDVSAKAGIGNVSGKRKALFVDVDHEGDLDLILTGEGPVTVYRNNLDGTFANATTILGFSSTQGASDAAFGDFNGDGRIDVVLTSERGVAVYRSAGGQPFSDVTAASGITGGAARAVAVGDYNNDGFLDLFTGGPAGPTLWLNRGDGSFAADRRSGALQPLRSIDPIAAEFFDYENDGWLDLVVGGRPVTGAQPGVFLFRNGNGA
ncbi:MAG TPA: FG-GAP-like repeat-containing protein, partial [Gemmatimonadaceae bacterium]|nr:FG-GAP-like repeat-containing protein [Gemmatimonadaceae bacterium]